MSKPIIQIKIHDKKSGENKMFCSVQFDNSFVHKSSMTHTIKIHDKKSRKYKMFCSVKFDNSFVHKNINRRKVIVLEILDLCRSKNFTRIQFWQF